LGSKLNGAEIGVGEGHNAKTMLCTLDFERLHLVDTFAGETPPNSYEKSLRILSPFMDKVQYHIMPSAEAAPKFADGSLDFVYIDADHSYQYVLQDCRAWWPKVKVGGIMAGHDWSIDDIKRAVREFAAANNLEIFIEETDESDWIIFKKG
jgi:predicted O-methyltransferase YrrM